MTPERLSELTLNQYEMRVSKGFELGLLDQSQLISEIRALQRERDEALRKMAKDPSNIASSEFMLRSSLAHISGDLDNVRQERDALKAEQEIKNQLIAGLQSQVLARTAERNDLSAQRNQLRERVERLRKAVLKIAQSCNHALACQCGNDMVRRLLSAIGNDTAAEKEGEK